MKAILLLCSVLVAAAWGAGENLEGFYDDENDSLRAAIDAVSRRQRDLASARPYGNALGSSLGRYRYPVSKKQVPVLSEDGLAFLPEDGQPENIGYGYQRSAIPEPPRIADRSGVTALERALLEYLKEAEQENGEEEEEEPMDLIPFEEKRRSAFREMSEFPQGKLEARKRMPSSFRERLRGDPGRFGDDLEEGEARKRFMTVIKKMEDDDGFDEEELPAYRESEGERYLDTLAALWERYRASNPGTDFENLSQEDAQRILEYVGENAEVPKPQGPIYRNERKRQYGTGYDHFNSHFGWGGAGSNWAKRGRLSPEDLESMSPAELEALYDSYVESERGVPGVGGFDPRFSPSDGSSLEVRRRGPDSWVPVVDRDEDSSEDFDKRVVPVRRAVLKKWYPESDYEALNRGPEGLEYLYSKQKRFPVTKRAFKRSSDHESLQKRKMHLERRKKDTTDPKVVKELSEIFSDGAHKHDLVQNKTEAPEVSNVTAKAQPNATSAATSAKPTIGTAPSNALDIKKKSIDWSDYFGIDRRRKKSNTEQETLEKNEVGTDKDDLDDWFVNEYYKNFAMSTNVKRKRTPEGDHHASVYEPNRSFSQEDSDETEDDELDRKKRRDGGNEESEGTSKSTLNNMEERLRTIEDLIVDQALKYTGAHEGITDRKEIEEVKEKVLSELAAAYSLEKMRKALEEFKSNLDDHEDVNAQQETKKSEHKESHEEADEKEKKEEQKEEPIEDKKKKDEDSANQVLNQHEQLLGKTFRENAGLEEAEFAECQEQERRIVNTCKSLLSMAGEFHTSFIEPCLEHGLCHACASLTGSRYRAVCDMEFLREANAICEKNAVCQRVAQTIAEYLMKLRVNEKVHKQECWRYPCMSEFMARRR